MDMIHQKLAYSKPRFWNYIPSHLNERMYLFLTIILISSLHNLQTGERVHLIVFFLIFFFNF